MNEIGEDAFAHCWALKRIVIPAGVEKVGEHAFWECYSLQNIAVLSDDTKIAEDAFEDCPGTVKRGTGSLF